MAKIFLNSNDTELCNTSMIFSLKNFHCRLSKIRLHYQTVTDQRLTVFHQLFSWTSVGPSRWPINKMIGLQGHLAVWGVPRVTCVLAKNSFTEIFSKLINVEIRRCKKFRCPLCKINLHYETVIDQKLTVVRQFFSWTSIGLSKCPIDKMIVW